MIHPWEGLVGLAGVAGWALSVLYQSRILLFLERYRLNGWRLDALCMLLPVLISAPFLRRTWSQISAYQTPMGADSDGNYASALAMISHNYSMYEGDRYPLYPYLVWLFSDGIGSAHWVGTCLSMAMTLLMGPVAYLLGRQLSGPAAGMAAAFMVYRLPLTLDIGRSYTPYVAVALLQLSAMTLAIALTEPWLAPGRRALYSAGLAGVAVMLMAADPKQLPVGLGLLVIGGVLSLFGVAALWEKVLGMMVVGGSFPLMNIAVGRLHLPLMSVEEITTRVNLGLVISETVTARVKSGFVLGGDLTELIPSLKAVIFGVTAAEGQAWLHPRALAAMPLVFPETSLFWLGFLGILPVVLVWRAWREGRMGRAWRVVAALLQCGILVFFASSSVSTLHLHYQHRYFLAQQLPLPVLILSAVPGGAALGGSLAAMIVSPYQIHASFMDHFDQQTDSWIGIEQPMWAETLAWAQQNLPADARVYDYAEGRPWPVFGAVVPYQRCNRSMDACRTEIAAQKGPVFGVVRGRETLSSRMAGVPATVDAVGVMPDHLGDWEKVLQIAPGVALYRRP